MRKITKKINTINPDLDGKKIKIKIKDQKSRFESRKITT